MGVKTVGVVSVVVEVVSVVAVVSVGVDVVSVVESVLAASVDVVSAVEVESVAVTGSVLEAPTSTRPNAVDETNPATSSTASARMYFARREAGVPFESGSVPLPCRTSEAPFVRSPGRSQCRRATAHGSCAT